MVSWRWRLKIPPKRWYPCTKLNVVTSCNSVTLIFNVAVTLKSRVFLPCFSFPVQLTQSVYTHSTAINRHPQNVTADCGWFRTFSERSARAVSWSDRPGARWRWTHRKIFHVYCVMCCRNTSCVSVRPLFIDGFSGVAAVCYMHTYH